MPDRKSSSKSPLPVLCLVLAGVLTACSTTNHSPSDPTGTQPVRRSMTVPESAPERHYLGLTADTGEFLIKDIKGEILIIDCFDLYCPTCQRGAERINELYDLISQRNLQSRIKMIGLGLGNTPLETETFRTKYGVPFPVFPDRLSTVARQFGEVRLPSLLVIRLGEQPAVIHRKIGMLRDPADLLDHILNISLEEVFMPTNASPVIPPAESCGDGECPVTLSGEPMASLI